MAIICLMAILTATANPITESQARSIATQFMSSHSMSPANLQRVSASTRHGAPRADEQQSALYVFAGQQQGFVIIAGDDRVPSVLGYSQLGTVGDDDMPPALLEMLEEYSLQIEALGQESISAPQHITGAAIAPLITTQWNQTSPYNSMLPYHSGGSQFVTGCVATAMAQVMNYYKWPQRASMTLPAYYTRTDSVYMPALEPITFRWNDMQDNYPTNITNSVSAIAVAQLMKHCAQSVKMDFKEGVSSAYTIDVLPALINYYGYKATCKYLMRGSYTTQQWETIIYNELRSKRPVLYSGSKVSSGHAYVCDGFDGEGRFHINWGWGGSYDGYYVLNILNPTEQTASGGSYDTGYILSQRILTGIEPGTATAPPDEMTINDLVINSATTTRSSTSDNFEINLSGKFYNSSPNTSSYSFGYGLYQGNTLVQNLLYYYTTNIQPGYYINLTDRTVNYGSGITSGTYDIVPMFTEKNTDNWRPCVGAEYNYITVTFNNNQCTVTGHGSAKPRNYKFNGATIEGHKHVKRPITVTLNVTNQGESENDCLYMFVDGTYASAAIIDIPKGQTGNIKFIHTPTTTGSKSISFSFDDSGSDPVYSTSVFISPMPSAWVEGYATVTNASGWEINDNKFSVHISMTNRNSSNYDEDIVVRLYKYIRDNYGSTVEVQNHSVTLTPGQKKDLYVDFYNVQDNWDYFVKAFYCSSGELVQFLCTDFYTINKPTPPASIKGDVNDDGEVTVADVNAIINLILGGQASYAITQASDVNGDGEITVADVNEVINIILKG